ncbi:MAG: 50S ribosomal protein L13 [Parcubacteria group bacterium CG_4_9_14_0_2_um_filter_35_11]|nr:MAG: 50S ribosomal protein L13 [Parcubacteria group bacterium CG07_land_8_20_14_0_80_35_11]PJC48125.1 MAG: 50S ribosomal protein L13 [Parcubacteria group bacterium CG_4_9_14_0_2_um_filter_35_11]
MKINATNKILGRLASEIAKILQGKDKPNFRPEKSGKEIVEVENVDKIKVTGKKLKEKIYYHYSGYPGGLKTITLEELIKKNPAEVLKRAVLGMLPKNRLQKQRIKRLKIK